MSYTIALVMFMQAKAKILVENGCDGKLYFDDSKDIGPLMELPWGGLKLFGKL